VAWSKIGAAVVNLSSSGLECAAPTTTAAARSRVVMLAAVLPAAPVSMLQPGISMAASRDRHTASSGTRRATTRARSSLSTMATSARSRSRSSRSTTGALAARRRTPARPGYQRHPRRVGHARAQHHRRARREAARVRHAARDRSHRHDPPGTGGCSPSRRRRSRSKTARSSRLPSMASPPCSTRRSSSRRFQRHCNCGVPLAHRCASHLRRPQSQRDRPRTLLPLPAADRASCHTDRVRAPRAAALRLRIPTIRVGRAPAYGAGMPARLTQEVEKRSAPPDTSAPSAEQAARAPRERHGGLGSSRRAVSGLDLMAVEV
jgi:hypothetical protein